jgi:2-haloacid dehalogenase
MAEQDADSPRARPKALLFDVFGTCVDWRSGVAREGETLGHRLGISGVDWFAFADAWRDQYQPRMEPVRSGQRPWVTLDVLHRESLDTVLAAFGLEDVPAVERDELTLAWRRLDPWPDVVEGLTRLKARYVIAPCSNGHIALMVSMAKRAGLPWDAILGAEIARAYKPEAAVYLRSVEALGLDPEHVMMVAAHGSDLAAAAACGLRTAYVPRPEEFGPGGVGDPVAGQEFDLVAGDFRELAELMDT